MTAYRFLIEPGYDPEESPEHIWIDVRARPVPDEAEEHFEGAAAAAGVIGRLAALLDPHMRQQRRAHGCDDLYDECRLTPYGFDALDTPSLVVKAPRDKKQLWLEAITAALRLVVDQDRNPTGAPWGRPKDRSGFVRWW